MGEIERLTLKLEKIKRLDSQLPNDICALLKNCVDEMFKVPEDEQVYVDFEKNKKMLEEKEKENKELEERFNAELAVKD